MSSFHTYLEASDRLRSSRLSNSFNGEAHANVGDDRIERGVDRADKPGVHRGREEEEEVVVLVQQGAFDINTGVKDGQ